MFFKISNSRYPFRYYSTQRFEGLYTYSSDEIRAGLGIIQKNYWNTELEYYWNKSGLQSEENLENPVQAKDNINEYFGFRILAQLDLLNDVLLPKDGIYIKGNYENSRTELGSSQKYEFYQAWGKIYKTFHLNTYGISGYHHLATNNTPLYKSTIFEGSKIFSGSSEFQLHGSSLTFFRIDYKYKHNRDIYAHFMVNWLMHAKSEYSNHTAENIWGFGTGITLISPLGPLEFIWCWGPENIYENKDWQSLFHFSAGYKF